MLSYHKKILNSINIVRNSDGDDGVYSFLVAEINTIDTTNDLYKKIIIISSLFSGIRHLGFSYSKKSLNDLSEKIIELNELIINNNSSKYIIPIWEYTMSLMKIPYCEGEADTVYECLLEENLLDLYMDGIRGLYFTSRKHFNNNIVWEYAAETMFEEANEIWKLYSGDNGLTDIIYFAYLSSNIKFKRFFI